MNAIDSSARPLRHTKSFVKREGRFTPAQEKAWLLYWKEYGLTCNQQAIAPEQIFLRAAPLVVEIGFGMGASLLETAIRHPESNFIGIEVHRPGVGALLHHMHAQQIKNIRIYCEDAVDVLTHALPKNSVDRFCIFFPDPWPKSRHHKRRLIQPAFVTLLASRLKMSGIIHLATDWDEYAAHMREVFAHSSLMQPTTTCIHADRPLTKYEARAKKLGHTVQDLMFAKIT